jgi:hypothetical protein
VYSELATARSLWLHFGRDSKQRGSGIASEQNKGGTSSSPDQRPWAWGSWQQLAGNREPCGTGEGAC